MYLDYFHLREHPFRLTPDSRYLYMGKGHARAMSYMEYTVWNRDSFVVITGEIGSGKTTLIQKLLAGLSEDVVVARLHQTQLDEIEFLQAILVEFGLDPFNLSKVQLLNMLNTFVIERYGEGKRVVLVVDEAQNLSRRVLEEVRLLTGLEVNSEKLLNVILVGQPELNALLDAPGMEQMVQRIRLRFHLKALSPEETGAYIDHRLAVAGAPADLVPTEARALIYRYTGGIPRLINTLCDTALICAFADEVRRPGLPQFQAAVEELQWLPYEKRQQQVAARAARAQELPQTQRFDELYGVITGEIGRIEERLRHLAQRIEGDR